MEDGVTAWRSATAGSRWPAPRPGGCLRRWLIRVELDEKRENSYDSGEESCGSKRVSKESGGQGTGRE